MADDRLVEGVDIFVLFFPQPTLMLKPSQLEVMLFLFFPEKYVRIGCPDTPSEKLKSDD